MTTPDPQATRDDHELVLGDRVEIGGVAITPVACDCGQWAARSVSTTASTSAANATQMHAKHIDEFCGPTPAQQAETTNLSAEEGSDGTEKRTTSDVVGGGLVLAVLGALLVGFLWVVGSALFGGDADSPETVYDDVECNAILGFANHDDVMVSERQEALDEYSENC